MPHYYFHLRTTDGPERDDEGITFPGLDGAKADALACLFEMASEELSAGHQSGLLGIDITDGQRTMLASVKMEDHDPHDESRDSTEGHAFIHGRGGEEKP